jgi:hypothetical protein
LWSEVEAWRVQELGGTRIRCNLGVLLAKLELSFGEVVALFESEVEAARLGAEEKAF